MANVEYFSHSQGVQAKTLKFVTNISSPSGVGPLKGTLIQGASNMSTLTDSLQSSRFISRRKLWTTLQSAATHQSAIQRLKSLYKTIYTAGSRTEMRKTRKM